VLSDMQDPPVTTMTYDLVCQEREQLLAGRGFDQDFQRSPKKARTASTTTTNPMIVRILYIVLLHSGAEGAKSSLRKPGSAQCFNLLRVLLEGSLALLAELARRLLGPVRCGCSKNRST
jgi:hypothetical protein